MVLVKKLFHRRLQGKAKKKTDLIFKNKNDAKNWAAQKLGPNKVRTYNEKGKWTGWKSDKGKVYWGHNDWGRGPEKSKFPHLNYDINGVTGHLFLKDKIVNRGMWDAFKGFFPSA